MYSECADICNSCRDQQLQHVCDDEICVPGCSCPEGEKLNDFGDCVDVDKCTCYDIYDKEIHLAGEISRHGCADW